MLRLSKLLILFLFLSPLAKGQTRVIPPEKPRLVVSIVIEEMRYDYLERFWNCFGDGGFKALVTQGASFQNTHINYMFTQSDPGYASIYTGANPSQHGIVGNKWYENLNHTEVGSVKDSKARLLGVSDIQLAYSPKQLIGTTFSDEFKLVYPESKIISIALTPNASVLSGGHSANTAYWFNEEEAKWTSSSYYSEALPNWVKKFNKKKLADSYLQKEWLKESNSNCTPARRDTCFYETGLGDNLNHFPYNIADLSRINEKYPDYSFINKTPFGNNFTKDFAIEAIVKEELGKDNICDFLMLNFTPFKNINRSFGVFSEEIKDTYIKFDRELAHFIEFLNSEIGKENVLLILTSNQGSNFSHSFLQEKKIPTGIFKSQYSIALLKSYLNATFGKGDWVKMYYNQQIYLNKTLIEDSKLQLREVQQKVVDFMIQFDAIANAVPAYILSATEFKTGIFKQMQNSYNQKRSGDVMLNLKPGWVEDSPYTCLSNSPYVYDTHIPLIWYGWRIKRQERSDKVSICDIAPSLSFLLNIAQPNVSTGQLIEGLIK